MTVWYEGTFDDNLVNNWAHLQVVNFDNKIAAFLNGKLLGMAENIPHYGNKSWIFVESDGTSKVRLDNIQFWSLDSYLSPSTQTATATPTITTVSLPYSWARLNSGQFLPRDTITAIVLDPNDPGVMYLGTRDAGIYKSIDGGVSCQPIHNGLGRADISTLINS